MTHIRDAAVHDYTESIKARRVLLELLFDSALVSISKVQTASLEVAAYDQAQWLAQDCGNAFFLINAYALERLLVASGLVAKPSESTFHDALKGTSPKAYANVPIGQAILTFAALARHLHEFQAGDTPRRYNDCVLKRLGIDPAHDQAAPQFLQNLTKQNADVKDYAGFERAVIRLAKSL